MARGEGEDFSLPMHEPRGGGRLQVLKCRTRGSATPCANCFCINDCAGHATLHAWLVCLRMFAGVCHGSVCVCVCVKSAH